jgi:hypothetical protein
MAAKRVLNAALKFHYPPLPPGFDGEVGELGNGIRFGPETDVAVQGAVGMKVNNRLLVQKTAAVVIGKLHPELVPTVHGCFDGGSGPFQALIVDEFKEDDIVLKRIDTKDEIVADVADAEGKSAGLVNAAGDGFNADAYYSFFDITFLGNGQGKVKVGPDIV